MLTLIIIFGSLALLALTITLLVIVRPPRESAPEMEGMEVQQSSSHSWRLGDNWIRKNNSDLWELFVKGEPYERGLATGKLTRELMYRQERLFILQVKRLIPSKIYLNFLKLIVALMNRRLEKHIGDEYCREIHGVSLSAPKEFSYIGPRYQRMLNYHAAHDIGHTLQEMHLVKCTAFSVWGKQSKNGEIFTGRNFDFYVGDDFSKEKIVCFCEPAKGYRFAYITWGGMIGSVSGMNEHGLAITVNAAKAEFPNGSATPVSFLVREILQYARNIKEAFALAEKKNIFVSECLIVSSAEDHKTIVIEKSRSQTLIFETEKEQLVCTNHFQSPELFNDPSNQKYLRESPSLYRYKRVEELMSRYDTMGEKEFAAILRNKLGAGDQDLGMGNESAVDQMLAHHSIIFNPDSRKFWISCGPYPEGAYHCYDLKKIFETGSRTNEVLAVDNESETIPQDAFLYSDQHDKFIKYKEYLALFGDKNNKKQNLDSEVSHFIETNPELFTLYSTLGDHYLWRKNYREAAKYYRMGLSKNIPNHNEKMHMERGLKKCSKHIAEVDKT